MKHIIITFLAICSFGCDNKIEVDKEYKINVSHSTRVDDNDSSINHHFIKNDDIEEDPFLIISDHELREILKNLYMNMYGSRFEYEIHLRALNSYDLGSHESYKHLKYMYVNNSNAIGHRSYFDLMMLITQVASSSSIDFLKESAKGYVSNCNSDNCKEWMLMTKTLAVSGLHRIHKIRNGYSSEVATSLIQIVSEEGNEEHVVGESVHMLNNMGYSNEQIEVFIHEEYTQTLNLQFTTDY